MSGIKDDDVLHHPTILVLKDVTVKHKAPHLTRIGERDDYLNALTGSDIHSVLIPHELKRLAIAADHLEIGLMDVEGMDLSRAIYQVPLLNCTKWNDDIIATWAV